MLYQPHLLQSDKCWQQGKDRLRKGAALDGGSKHRLALQNRQNKFLAFFYNLVSTLIACSRIQKGDVIVLQYPVKKYFSFICKMAHLKGAKTISLIHDLGSFRRKKLTVAQELKRLSHTDYIIATNQAMKLWLEQQGLEKPIGALGFHDYLSPSVAADKKHQPNKVWNIVYAGSLNLRKTPLS